MPSRTNGRTKASSRRKKTARSPVDLKRAPLAVGLTGNIGSGKSTVAALFRELGVPTFDTDKIGHELLESNPAVRSKIGKTFGSEVVEHGPVDRRKLGAIAFGSPEKRRKLESILHPAIMSAVSERIARLGDRDYAVVEVPLLYEARLADRFDYVILVKAYKEIAVARASANLGIGKDEVLKRLDAQIPQSEKEKLADFVIANNGSKEDLKRRVMLLHSVVSSLASEES